MSSSLWLALIAVIWFVGFAVLRVLTARIAVSLRRGTMFELLTSLGWMAEPGTRWARMGKVTITWLVAGPMIFAVLLAIAAVRR